MFVSIWLCLVNNLHALVLLSVQSTLFIASYVLCDSMHRPIFFAAPCRLVRIMMISLNHINSRLPVLTFTCQILLIVCSCSRFCLTSPHPLIGEQLGVFFSIIAKWVQTLNGNSAVK